MDRIGSLKRYFDEVIEPNSLSRTRVDISKINVEVSSASFNDSINKYVSSLIGDIKNKRILEFGFGIGLNLIDMGKRGAYVTGIDISEERVKFARELIKHNGLDEFIQVFNMGAEDLDFEDNSFDIIYGYDVLMYLEGNLDVVLKEFHRVLKKGGHGIFVEPLRNNPLAFLYRKFFAPKEWEKFTTYLTLYDLNQFNNKFWKVNFKTFYLLGFLAFFWKTHVPSKRMFKICESLLYKFDEALMGLFPALRKYSWRIAIQIEKI